MYIYVCEDLDERSLEFLEECHIHCAIFNDNAAQNSIFVSFICSV